MSSLTDVVRSHDLTLLDTCAICGHIDERTDDRVTKIMDYQRSMKLITRISDLVESGAPLYTSEGVIDEITNYRVNSGEISLSYVVGDSLTRKKILAAREYGVALKRLKLKFIDFNRVLSLKDRDESYLPRLSKAIREKYRGNMSDVDANLLYLATLNAIEGSSVALLTRDKSIQRAWILLTSYFCELAVDNKLDFYWADTTESFLITKERFKKS
ncbi:hypothetical protein J4438_04070 [Candidatus Woesearchaeota archaeon]|nr:hypothetical protein [Candidatus Woesearchaeota archaeon]